MKAFRLREEDNILWKVKDYMDIADMFLFDTEGVSYGGTGKKFDWNLLQGLSVRKPFFLSGGIEVGDIGKIKEFSKEAVAKDLFSLDVNSKFELSPGIKDMEKLKRFIKEIKTI